MSKKVIYLLILLVVIVSVASSFLLQSFNKKEIILDINSSLIQDLYQKVFPNESVYILKQFYNNGITNEYKINLGILNLVKKNNSKDFLISSDVEKSIKDILGENATMNHQTIYFYINGFCGYEFNEAEERYEPFNGCGGEQLEFFHRKIISAKEIDSKIIIREQLVYAHLESTNLVKDLYIYNNPREEKLLDYIQDYQGFYRSDGEKFIDQGSIYKYVFSKENDNYILEKIEEEK